MPAPPPSTTGSRPEWLGARAALAGRRSVRFAVVTAAAFVVSLVTLLFVPAGSGSREAAAISQTERTTGPLHPPAVQRTKRDSMQLLASELDSLIARAANAPLPDSYRALAAAAALHGDTR